MEGGFAVLVSYLLPETSGLASAVSSHGDGKGARQQAQSGKHFRRLSMHRDCEYPTEKVHAVKVRSRKLCPDTAGGHGKVT